MNDNIMSVAYLNGSLMAVGTDTGLIKTLDLQLYFESNDIEIIDTFKLSAG